MDTQLTMSAEERDVLVGLLEIALKEAQIEEHRTRAPSFREHVLKRENAIVSLLSKLRPK